MSVPLRQNPAATDAAVVTLVAWLVEPGGGDTGLSPEKDIKFVQEVCVPAAYRHRPPGDGDDAGEWCDRWVAQMIERARELRKSAQFRRLHAALVRELDSHLTLSGERIIEILAAAGGTTEFWGLDGRGAGVFVRRPDPEQDPRRRAYLQRLAELADARAGKWPAGSSEERWVSK